MELNDMDGLEKLINSGDHSAGPLDPILIDCKNLTRFDLLFTLSDTIGTILKRVKHHSLVSYEVGLLGNARTLEGLPKFENIKTIPDEYVPDRTLFILTIKLDGVLVIRPANHQSWEEYFLDFIRMKEPERVLVTHPHLQARLINCPIEE